jgi:hypothetical protein
MSTLLAFLVAIAELSVHPSCGTTKKNACTADADLTWRHPTFALATDAPNGVTLSGRMVLTCADGGERTVFLPSIPAAGALATVGNTCPNFAAKRVRIVVESASIPGAESARVRVLGTTG